MKRAETSAFLDEDYSVRLDDDGSYDALQSVFQLGPYLIQAARVMRKKATSYRKVHFGGVTVANNVKEQRIRYYPGWNFTPHEGAPKYCAEVRADGRASKEGYRQLEAVIIAGPSDPKVIESINGLVIPTADPCRRPCLSRVVKPETVVISIGEDDFYEAHTGAQLMDFYEQVDARKPKSRVRRRDRVEDSGRLATSDPNFNQWVGREAIYNELKSGIDFSVVDNPRLVRAELAVTALTASLEAPNHFLRAV